MFISRKCLDAVGLLEESYFLYYEELDLAGRVSPKISPSILSTEHRLPRARASAAHTSGRTAASSRTFIKRGTILF
jgi:GT2 family glycosyltransferase